MSLRIRVFTPSGMWLQLGGFLEESLISRFHVSQFPCLVTGLLIYFAMSVPEESTDLGHQCYLATSPECSSGGPAGGSSAGVYPLSNDTRATPSWGHSKAPWGDVVSQAFSHEKRWRGGGKHETLSSVKWSLSDHDINGLLQPFGVVSAPCVWLVPSAH